MDFRSLSDEQFYALIRHVYDKMKVDLGLPKLDKWVSGDEAMHLLRISSKTTLQKLRDGGHIRYTQPEKKIILYDTESIMDYLDKHAKDTF